MCHTDCVSHPPRTVSHIVIFHQWSAANDSARWKTRQGNDHSQSVQLLVTCPMVDKFCSWTKCLGQIAGHDDISAHEEISCHEEISDPKEITDTEEISDPKEISDDITYPKEISDPKEITDTKDISVPKEI